MPNQTATEMSTVRDEDGIYRDLVRRIRVQRGLHRYYELRTRFSATLIRVINIVLPAHIVFFVFSDITTFSRYVPWLTPFVVEIFIGVAGFILFITSILTEVFKGDRRHLDHRRAIERCAELLQEIKLCDLQAMSGKMRGEAFENFHKRYLQITVTSPTFTDKQFERASAYLLRQKALKLARRENPFAHPWRIRKIALSKVKEVLEDEEFELNRLSSATGLPSQDSPHTATVTSGSAGATEGGNNRDEHEGEVKNGRLVNAENSGDS